jgi:hypothetical protein
VCVLLQRQAPTNTCQNRAAGLLLILLRSLRMKYNTVRIVLQVYYSFYCAESCCRVTTHFTAPVANEVQHMRSKRCVCFCKAKLRQMHVRIVSILVYVANQVQHLRMRLKRQKETLLSSE